MVDIFPNIAAPGQVMIPTVHQMKAEGKPFKGVLFLEVEQFPQLYDTEMTKKFPK